MWSQAAASTSASRGKGTLGPANTLTGQSRESSCCVEAGRARGTGNGTRGPAHLLLDSPTVESAQCSMPSISWASTCVTETAEHTPAISKGSSDR